MRLGSILNMVRGVDKATGTPPPILTPHLWYTGKKQKKWLSVSVLLFRPSTCAPFSDNSIAQTRGETTLVGDLFTQRACVWTI